LERIGERARPAPDAFVRIERARRRRDRNRRVGAGIVAVVVAMAGSFAAFTAFRDGGARTAGGGEGGFHALWPESTLERTEEEQQRVASGDPDVQWRLDPEATALRFVNDALGWSDDPAQLAVSTTTSPDGVTTVEIQTPPVPCPSPPVPECLPRDVTVRLRQLVPDGGIWSVVSVESSVFNAPIQVGAEVALGGHIAIATGLPDGTEVAVGVGGTGSCSGFQEQTAAVLDGFIVLPVRGVSEGCAGYLYAVTPSTPVGQVELGRIMFVYHEPKPALGYTISAITAVPVRFVPAEVGPTPSVAPSLDDALHVTCGGGSITTDAMSVAAQAAGVHVVVENTSGDPLFFQLAPERLGPWGGTEVQPGITEIALQAPPGTLTVRCSTEGSPTDEIAVEVLDPQGLFVPFTVTCPGLPEIAYTISVTAWEGSESAPGPVEFVRGRVEGLLPSDTVEHAGYPEAPNPAVRVVRDGAVVAGFELYLENGQWGVDGTWCSEMGIAVPPGPDPYPRGAFEWCPPGPFPEAGFQWRERASEAAVQFVHADVNGDEATISALLDESVPAGADFPIALAGDAAVVIGASAAGGELVRFACGPDVDAYTVAITIDDGTDSASMDFTVFLVFRGVNGWKVWAVY
jgi:hypothetical protein